MTAVGRAAVWKRRHSRKVGAAVGPASPMRADIDGWRPLLIRGSEPESRPQPSRSRNRSSGRGLTKGTVSRQIDSAVAAGLMTVRVASHTRREHAVALTEAGTALVRRGDALTQTSRATMLDAIDPKELTAAVHVLGGLLRALDP